MYNGRGGAAGCNVACTAVARRCGGAVARVGVDAAIAVVEQRSIHAEAE